MESPARVRVRAEGLEDWVRARGPIRMVVCSRSTRWQAADISGCCALRQGGCEVGRRRGWRRGGGGSKTALEEVQSVCGRHGI